MVEPAQARASTTYSTMRRPCASARSVVEPMRSTPMPAASQTALVSRSTRAAGVPAVGGPICTANGAAPSSTRKSRCAPEAAFHWPPVTPAGLRGTAWPSRRPARTALPARANVSLATGT
jgi:hypothetical protein